MPLTPFHFGPSALVALPFGQRIDLPAFVLANVVIDLEPAAALFFNVPIAIHGPLHSWTIGPLVGALWGWLAWQLRPAFAPIMRGLRLSYAPTLFVSVISGALGFAFHVLLDAVMHADIKLLWPLAGNPLLRLISVSQLYQLTIWATLVAISAIVLRAMWRRLGKKISP